MTILGTHLAALLLILMTHSTTLLPGSRPSTQSSSAAPLTAVSAQQQPDSPLQISAIVNHSLDPKRLHITFSFSNVTGKAVRAYAIKHEVVCCGSKDLHMGGSELSLCASREKLFLPGESSPGELANQWSSSPYEKVVFSVDFVEFADGTRWGADAAESGRRLDGMRAGMRAAKAELVKILAEGGTPALLVAIEEDALAIPTQKDSPEVWARAFKTGVQSVSARLRHAYKSKGDEELVKVLRQPFDASDLE